MSAHRLIIGGTRGMGRALVRRWAAAGQAVSVMGRRTPYDADRRMAHVRHWTVDVSDERSLKTALNEVMAQRGRVRSVVFFQRYRGAENDWEGELATSLTATKRVIERLVDGFEREGDRSIVIVSSMASQFIAQEQPLSYHVAKAGLAQMVRFYAVALGSSGIRVNSVSSGMMLKEESRTFYQRHRRLQRLYEDIIPLGRIGKAEELASVIAFLCSPQASFITGQNLIVDGGLSLQWHESLARQVTSLRTLAVTRKIPVGSR